MKRLKKGLVLILALALTICTLASCSSGATAMRYGSKELSESDYAYLMAFIKGYYEYYYSYMAMYYGYEYSLDQMWDQDIGDGKTFAEAMTESVNDAAKMLLVVEQLCAEAGLTVQDAESLAEVSDVMQELMDNYGGEDALQIELARLGLKASSIERYELYNQMLSLLREYRYGANGVARLSKEEVRKSFLETYAKAEGYLYSYLVVDGNGSRADYQYDFAADYAKEDVEAYFVEHFYRIRYLRYKKAADANAAYTALTDGSTTFGDAAADAEKAVDNAYVTEGDLSDTLYKGVTETAENEWFRSGEEGEYYYVIQRLSFDASDLEDAEQEVRDAMLEREARAYFEDNYVTVQHILYKDEAKAKEVYDALQAGTTTIEEHKSETADGGFEYTFTYGAMVDPFEEAAFEMKVGAYALVESEFGWHVMTRLELNADAYKTGDAVAAMTRELLQGEAEDMYEAIKSGSVDFKEPDKDALYTYSEPTLLELSKQAESLSEALENAADNEVIYVDLSGYGVFILRKLPTTDEDLSEIYDTVEAPLIEDAFYSYLGSFYDAVVVNSEVIDRFDIKTAKTFYY